MRYGDKYKHFKGTEYTFRGIALPLEDLTPETRHHLEYIGVARYHENTHDIDLYALDGALFLDADKPHVIYQSEQDYGTGKYWAREVDDFFGYKNIDGSFIKKFTLVI